jgi:hypothetical protein
MTTREPILWAPMMVLTGEALGLFRFSVGQEDYGAKVEVARG